MSRSRFALGITAVTLVTFIHGCGKKDKPVAEGANATPQTNASDSISEDQAKIDRIKKKTQELKELGKAVNEERKKPQISLSEIKPDIILTSIEYNADMKKIDRETFLKKYGGKVLEVSGPLEDTGSANGTDGTLFLTPPLSSAIFRVKSAEPWKLALPGQIVTVRKLIETSDNDPKFSPWWEIIKVEGSGPVAFTADQFAGELEKLGDLKMNAAYKNKKIILTGTIRNVEIQDIGHAVVQLETTGSDKVVCIFPASDAPMRERLKGLKAGQKIKVLGSHDYKLKLEFCVPLEVNP